VAVEGEDRIVLRGRQARLGAARPVLPHDAFHVLEAVDRGVGHREDSLALDADVVRRLLAQDRDVDRRVRPLQGRDVQGDVVEPEEPALMADATALEQARHHAQRLVEPVALLGRLDAEALELVLQIARAEPEH
jgi:hypothetical protein